MNFTIPNEPQPSPGDKFNVPQWSEIELLSPVESLALGRLYGIGIGSAIVRQKLIEESSGDTYQMPYSTDYPYSPDALPNEQGGYDKTATWDGHMASSLVGMPVLCYLKIVGGDYRDLQGNVITVPEIIFETVVITLTMNKNIVKTQPSGRDSGSIKEYIGLDDWDIEIRTIITADAPVNSNIQKKNQDGVFPRDNMNTIYSVLSAPIALQVECWFLNMFDINYIVIDKGITIQIVENDYSAQRLIIPAVSDNPLIISIAQ